MKTSGMCIVGSGKKSLTSGPRAVSVGHRAVSARDHPAKTLHLVLVSKLINRRRLVRDSMGKKGRLHFQPHRL